MDGYNYDEFNDDSLVKNENNKTKIIFIVIMAVLIILLVIFLPKLLNNPSRRYSNMEERLIESAKAYVINNNITIDSEIYLDVNTLKISLDGDCLLTSGVIFDGKNYYPNLVCNDYQSPLTYNSTNYDKINYRLIPSGKTVDDVTIAISINDINYDYIELPNNEKINEKYITYKVSENGSYKFNIYDKEGNVNEKIIEVSNIENIDYGTCLAKWKNDYTMINVIVNDGVIVNSYEYIISDKTESISASNEFSSKTLKPEKVVVKIKIADGKTGKIKCDIDEKMEPQIVTNEKGKNCLEGYICYIQYDYQDSKYPFCSMDPVEKPQSCGGIGRHGCSLTSASIAIANLGVKSMNGELYNPFTVWEELYPIADRKNGSCWGGCSGWSNIRRSVIKSGLSADTKANNLSKSRFTELLEHLRNGYPIIVHASDGPYTSGSGHYMTLLATREDNYVYLSDPALTDGTKKEYYSGRQYYADTWVTLDDLVSGKVDTYLLVGPPDYFK